MSFLVKLPFTRPKKEEKACTSCSFTTRNEVLFQRHVNLCSGVAAPATSKALTASGKAGNAAKKGQAKDADKSRQYYRNYVCESCNFSTYKPRQFLQHRVQSHGEKLSIWQCDRCDYASKYRHKLERHYRLIHHSKLQNAVEEFVSAKSKRKPAVVTRIRRMSGGQQQRGIPTALGDEAGSAAPADGDKDPSNLSAETNFIAETTTSSGEQTFLCKLCSYAGNSRDDLAQHVKSSHSSNLVQHKCDVCDFVTYDKNEFFTHKASHASGGGSVLFSCAECDYVTEKKRNYERHMASHTKTDGTHKCYYCSFTSSTESAVHRHMGQYHKSKGPIALLITRKPGVPDSVTSTNIAGYAQPEISVSNPDPEPLVQDSVDNSVNEDINVDDHDHDHDHDHEEVGGVRHVDAADIELVEFEDHDDDDDDETAAGPGELVCGECGFEARTMKSLLKHLDSHVNPTADEPKPRPRPTPKPNEAEVAQEDLPAPKLTARTLTPQKRQMSDDERSETSSKRMRDTSEEPESIGEEISPKSDALSLNCTYCSYIAKWPSDLRRHLKVHTMERRFSCQFCGRMYKYHGDLNVHMKKSHTQEYYSMEKKEKVYTCPLCQYSTVSKKMYSSHFEMHAEVDFTCIYCKEKFKPYQTIKTHLEYTHAEDLSMETAPLEDIIDRCLDPDHAFSVQSVSPLSSKESTPTPVATPVATPVKSPSPASSVNSSTSSLQQYQIAVGKWKCPHCPYLTHAGSKLRAHLYTHENIKPFKCPECNKRSNWKWDIVKHQRSAHKDVKPKPVIMLDKQVARDTIEQYLIECPPLSKSPAVPLSSVSSASVTSDEPPSTPTSDMSFELGSSAIYRCSLCDFENDGIVQVQMHSRDIHKGLARTIDLRKEQVPAKLYKCSSCGQRSNWKADLRKHIRMKHAEGTATVIPCEGCTSPVIISRKDKAAINTTHIEDNWPFVCSLCDYTSVYKHYVTNHAQAKHPNSVVKVSLMSELYSKDLRPYKCPLCSRRVKFVWDMKKHMRYVHPNCTREPLRQQYKCSQCEFTSQQPNDIPVHLDASHNGEGEVKIVMAAEKEASPAPPSADEDSSKMDVGDDDDGHKVWKCIMCNFTAGEKIDAMHHLVNSHPANKYPYECKVCGHQFNFLSATYRHLRAKHGKNDYSLCRKNLVYVTSDDHSHKASETQLKDKQDKTDTVSHEDVNNSAPAVKHETMEYDQSASPKVIMRYQCEICPYQTNKIGMFKIHKSHHKKTPGNTYKCKFCNYYVCAGRLLHQHVRLHLTNGSHYIEHRRPNKFAKVHEAVPQEKSSYVQCLKCPYYATSARDLMYHKQFHRPKATAPFKCNFCDYWVSLKDKLQGHVVVHDPEYASAHDPRPSSTNSNGSSGSITIDPNAVETAALKQHIIQSKMRTVFLRALDSPSPPPSPSAEDVTEGVEIAFPEPVVVNGNQENGEASNSDPEVVNNNNMKTVQLGMSLTIHRCKHCPYGNPRAVNVRMHEEMHGKGGKDRIKCPDCDYFCGNMGLMAHHAKVHRPDYNPQQIYSAKALNKLTNKKSQQFTDLVKTPTDLSQDSAFRLSFSDKSKRYMLSTSGTKKYCCEKCPYASVKRDQFERHLTLHCSKQKYVCSYCDYSVPTHNLLLQHQRLHVQPNKNLLAAQSINNLQELPLVTADIAMTTGLTTDQEGKPVPDTHDDMDLYENKSPDNDAKPKKLYRCDRCPYTNVSRDHLLTHLKSHIMRNEFECPYCDYSVNKVQLLAQHVNIHFNSRVVDADGALPVPLNASAKEINEMKEDEPEFIDLNDYGKVLKVNAGPTSLNQENGKESVTPVASSTAPPDVAKATGVKDGETVWICQFCDRGFHESEHLIKHEMQHLIGNKLLSKRI